MARADPASSSRAGLSIVYLGIVGRGLCENRLFAGFQYAKGFNFCSVFGVLITASNNQTDFLKAESSRYTDFIR